MTIASEITRIKTNIDNAYTALETKGATIPDEKNSANLAGTVNTITTGGARYFIGYTLNQIAKGEIAVRNWTVSLKTPDDNTINISPSGLSSAFYGCTRLTSVDLSNVTSISNLGLDSAFRDCTRLTSVDLSNVTRISYFSLSFAFYGCTELTSVDLSNVTRIGPGGLSSAFYGCTELTSLSFPALKSDSFDSYTNQFSRMLQGVTGCTVHFPSNLESVIGQWDDVLDGFGGTDTVVLFDLPSTETSGDGTGGGYGDGGYS